MGLELVGFQTLASHDPLDLYETTTSYMYLESACFMLDGVQIQGLGLQTWCTLVNPIMYTTLQ